MSLNTRTPSWFQNTVLSTYPFDSKQTKKLFRFREEMTVSLPDEVGFAGDTHQGVHRIGRGKLLFD